MVASKHAFQITPDFYLQSLAITDVKKAIRADRVLGRELRSGLLELADLELVGRSGDARIQKAAFLLLRSPGQGGPQYPVAFGKALYQAVEEQLRKILCSPNGGPYRKELEQAKLGLHALIAALSVKLAALLGIDGPALIAAIYAVLVIIVKMGKSVWCSMTKPKRTLSVPKKAPAKRASRVVRKTTSRVS